MDQKTLRQFLQDAALYARDVEMGNNRIDAIDIGVFPHGVSVVARRNRLGQRHTLTASWEELELAVVNPLLTLIDEVTGEVNKPPTTHF